MRNGEPDPESFPLIRIGRRGATSPSSTAINLTFGFGSSQIFSVPPFPCNHQSIPCYEEWEPSAQQAADNIRTTPADSPV